jgi:Cu/Ag efflux pump CusA
MFSPLFITQSIIIYGSAVLFVLITAILMRYFFSNSVKNKLQE